MDTITARVKCAKSPSFEGVDIYAYVDTLELFFRRFPLAAMDHLSKQVWVKEVWSKGVWQGFKLILHKPDLDMLREADRLQVRHNGTVCRFDLAYDFIAQSTEQFENISKFLDHGILLKWRPAGPMREEERGWYATDFTGRRRPGRNLAFYTDKPSKETGEVDCAHLEIRFLNTTAVRRTRVERVKDLLTLNPQVLFNHNIRLVDFNRVEFEKVKRPVIRRTVRDRNGTLNALKTDRILNRIFRGRVQLVKDAFSDQVNKLQAVDMSPLIPNRLSALPAHAFVENTREFHRGT